MSDVERKKMSYAASFKLEAVKAADETNNPEAAKNLEWIRAILEDGKG